MKGDPTWLNVVRDLACILIGSFGLVYSTVTGVTSPELIAAYVTLLGVPGVVNLLELRGSRRESSDTERESSASPPLGSRSRRGKSSHPSTEDSEDET